MRQINLYEPQKLQIDEVPVLALEDGYAIIKIKYCGICGSDTGAYRGSNPTTKFPIIGLGHEGVGYIEEIGENEKGLKKGDLVTLEPYISCGTCHQCKIGQTGNCTDIKVCGVHTVGMMSDYFRHPIRLIHKVPEGLSPELAALTEPFSIGMQAASQGTTKEGDVCLIFGSGVIGLVTAFAAIHRGATPIIVDVVGERLEKAKELGIENVFNSKEGDLFEFLKEFTNGKMADVVIDCTGSPFVLKDIHLYCAYGAHMVLVGWPRTAIEFNTIKCMQKQLTICTSRNSSGMFPICMDLIKSGFLPAEKFTSGVVTVDETEETLKKIISNPEDYLKVLIDFEK